MLILALQLLLTYMLVGMSVAQLVCEKREIAYYLFYYTAIDNINTIMHSFCIVRCIFSQV